MSYQVKTETQTVQAVQIWESQTHTYTSLVAWSGFAIR